MLSLFKDLMSRSEMAVSYLIHIAHHFNLVNEEDV